MHSVRIEHPVRDSLSASSTTDIEAKETIMNEQSLFMKFWTNESTTTRNVLARIPEGSDYRRDPNFLAPSGPRPPWRGAFSSTSFTIADRSRRTSARWDRTCRRSMGRAETNRKVLCAVFECEGRR